jgi:hypothetical protein
MRRSSTAPSRAGSGSTEPPDPRGVPTLRRPKRWAAGLLVTGCVLALATPGYLGLAAPRLAGYLWHPVIFLAQLVPFAVCAAVWLPRRAPEAATVALTFAALLFVTTAVAYLPMLWAPGAQGGDMIGLGFLAMPAVATAALVVASASVGLALWWRRRTS